MSPSWDFFGMAWFKAFRNEFGYAYYGEQRLPVMLDVPLTVVIYVCLCISIAFMIAAAGIQGKERWYALIRLVYSLLIGSVILVSIFGHSWQVAYNEIKAPYIYSSDSYIDGKIGINIGLYTVNITLTGYFEGNKVDYNEEILLEDINGPATELYHALDRGLPHPILMVLEHFDIDEGGLRFGRSCKIAGHFAGILLWTAFAFWIASNIILCSVVCNGAVCFTASGVCMVLAIVVYHHLNLSLGFRLPGSQGKMQLCYGWCLLSTLILGIITTLFGILLILADYKYPNKVAGFFFLETALESHHEDYIYRYPVPVADNNKTGTYYARPVQDNKGWFLMESTSRQFDYGSPIEVQHSCLNYNFDLYESEQLNSDQISSNQSQTKCNALFGRQLKNNEKRLTTTLNRYLNYGFECSPNKKKSPFFGGSDSDLSTIHEGDGPFSPDRRFPE